MRRLIWLAAGVLLCAASASAQAPECDKPDLSTLGTQQSQTGSAFIWNVCPFTADLPKGIVIYVNGVPRPEIPLVPASNPIPNAAGQVPYVASLNIPKGTYQVMTAMTYDDANGARQVSPNKSAPFAFTVIDPVVIPRAPKNTR